MRYNVNKTVIKDSLFALIVTLLVHVLFLVLFVSPPPKVRANVQPLPPVSVIDLTDTSNPFVVEQLEFIRRNDPATFVLGSESIGFSYVNRAPEMRGLSAPPEFNYSQPREPLKQPIIDEVNVPKFKQPQIGGNQYLTASLLELYKDPPPQQSYPVVASGEKRFDLKFSDQQKQAMAKLTMLDTVINFEATQRPKDPKKYGHDLSRETSGFVANFADMMPRVNIIKSCGNSALESYVVSELLKNSQLRGLERDLEIKIRWRER